MRKTLIRLWCRAILNWLDMIRSATSIPCTHGREKNTAEAPTVWRAPETEPECSAEYNPVGSYIKRFDLDPELCSKRVRICFEGVEEAMYLWLNGQFVGYAEDSFTPSEFDLTPFIREKGNVLAVQVHKMSTAAFLEDQDLLVLDQKDLDLSTVADEAKPYVAAILTGVVIRHFVEAIAFERGHSLDVRRYMWQMQY